MVSSVYTVMLIDDEPWILARLRTIVDWEALGFQIVCEAGDPASAWEQLQALHPDVVVMDIRMPEYSGLDILQAARRRGVSAEFLIVSGYDDFSYARQAIAGGVFYYFLKPVDAQEFERELRRLRTRLDGRAPSSPAAPEEEAVLTTPCRRLNEILRYIRENYQSPLTLAVLSKEFFLSPTYICDLFSQYTDFSFVQYLTETRIRAAGKKLRETDRSVSRIAAEAGFRDYSYFSKVFRQKTGMSPSEYRRNR